VNDAVDRLIVERGEMDQGLPGGLILSVGGHALLLGSVVFVAILGPKEPLLKVVDGFAVALPPGGGGSPTPQEPAPGMPKPEPPKPETTLPAKPQAPKVTKPPKEEKAKGHCRIADTGDNESFARSGSICRILVPESDQKIAAKTDTLPPKVEEQKIISQDKDEHRAHEQVHVCKETAITFFI